MIVHALLAERVIRENKVIFCSFNERRYRDADSSTRDRYYYDIDCESHPLFRGKRK
jgi:hypothetical protein